MNSIILRLPKTPLRDVWRHLIPREMTAEEAAFAFVGHAAHDDVERLDLVEWFPVLPEEFASRSCYHLDLGDEVRVRAIMRAHALGCSIVELHSHCGAEPARFSTTDLSGFEEFVPHVWWRLEGGPYAAVVVAKDSFDGLVWLKGPREPERLNAIVTDDGTRLLPTHLSPVGLTNAHD